MVHGRHRDYYLALAERAEPELHGPNQLLWLDALETEQDNLRAALGWSLDSTRAGWTDADADAGLRLAIALGQFWLVQGHLSEGRRWLVGLLELAPRDTLNRARGLYQAGWLALAQGDLPHVHSLLEPGLSLARRLDDRLGIVLGLHLQASLQTLLGNHERAADLLDTALPTFETDGSNRTLGMWLYCRAQAARALGNAKEAVDFAQKGLALSRASGNPWEIRHWVILLAHLKLYADPTAAAALLREGLAISQRMRDRQGAADGIESLGWAGAALGQSERAARLLGSAEAVRDSIGLALFPIWHSDHARAEATVRETLGDTAYETAARVGRALRLDEAIAYGLSESPHLPAADPDVDPLVAGLTPREREVAGLLTAGLSNRGIAESLVISEGTAAIHVRNILNKLGFSSRAQITAWAVRRGMDERAAD